MSIKSIARLVSAKFRDRLNANLAFDASLIERASINVNKAYKPRVLKNDTAHRIARRLAKIKRRNPVYRQKLARQRKQYTIRNGAQLRRRAQKVQEIRRQRHL